MEMLAVLEQLAESAALQAVVRAAAVVAQAVRGVHPLQVLGLPLQSQAVPLPMVLVVVRIPHPLHVRRQPQTLVRAQRFTPSTVELA